MDENESISAERRIEEVTEKRREEEKRQIDFHAIEEFEEHYCGEEPFRTRTGDTEMFDVQEVNKHHHNVHETEDNGVFTDDDESPHDSGYLYRENFHWSNLVVELAPWVGALIALLAVAIVSFDYFVANMDAQQIVIFLGISVFVVGSIALGTWRTYYKHTHTFICVRYGDLRIEEADNKWLFLFGDKNGITTRNFHGKGLDYSFIQKFITHASDLVVTLHPAHQEVVDGEIVKIPADTQRYKRVKKGELLLEAIIQSVPHT